MLNDFEVGVTMLKFMIGIGIFNRAMLYSKAGLFQGVLVELLGLFMAV